MWNSMKMTKKMLRILCITVLFMVIWISATSFLIGSTKWWMCTIQINFREVFTCMICQEQFLQALCYKKLECQTVELLYLKQTTNDLRNGLLKDMNLCLVKILLTKNDSKEWFFSTNISISNFVIKLSKKAQFLMIWKALLNISRNTLLKLNESKLTLLFLPNQWSQSIYPKYTRHFNKKLLK